MLGYATDIAKALLFPQKHTILSRFSVTSSITITPLMKYLTYFTYSLLFIIFTFSSCNRPEQTPKTEIQQDILPTNLQVGNTPVSEYVVELFQDKSGDIWMGTMNGLIKLHDNKLTYFTTEDGLAGNEIPGLAQDREGNIWIGTHTGASRYDGKTFTNYGPAEGIEGPGCIFLVDSKGTLWAATNKVLARFNGKTFDRFELPNPNIPNPYYKWELGKIWALMEDSKGNIWFGRDGYGACKYDGRDFTLFTDTDGLCSNNVATIAEDKAGNIWFGSITSDFPKESEKGGVSRYDGKQFIQFPEIKGLFNCDIYTIFQAPRGDLWISAIGVGAYRYDGQNFHLISQIDRSDLASSFAIQAVLQDRASNLWFGFSGGLFQLDGNRFVHRSKESFGHTGAQ